MFPVFVATDQKREAEKYRLNSLNSGCNNLNYPSDGEVRGNPGGGGEGEAKDRRGRAKGKGREVSGPMWMSLLI